jgi:hypothetical protein
VVVALVAGPLHGRRLLHHLLRRPRAARRLDHRLVRLVAHRRLVVHRRLEAHLHLDLLHHPHRGQP